MVHFPVREGRKVTLWNKNPTASEQKEEIRKWLLVTPFDKDIREKEMKKIQSYDSGCGQSCADLYRFYRLSGQPQWDERLGVVTETVLSNRFELLEQELVDISQKIEELERSRRMGEVLEHMTVKDINVQSKG